jgi:hypothetical protein
MDIDNEQYDFIDTAYDIEDNDMLVYDDDEYNIELEHDYGADDDKSEKEDQDDQDGQDGRDVPRSPTILAEDESVFKSPLTPMPYPDDDDVDIEISSESGQSNKTNITQQPLPMPEINVEIRSLDHDAKQFEEEASTQFKYQQALRVYVNRCMFIRNTSIGKRVGFAPTIPKTTEFVLCWNCNDWIPPHVSPPCIPLCSQTHMHSKYVFEKMFGYFCSWGCCKKYIFETMSERNKTKYMRSLLQLRRIFYPDDNNKPIQMTESRTCTTLYGGPTDPESYYSKIDKVNLPPLPEDTLFALSRCNIDDPSTDINTSNGGSSDGARK